MGRGPSASSSTFRLITHMKMAMCLLWLVAFMLDSFSASALTAHPFLSPKEAKTMLNKRGLSRSKALATRLDSRSEIEDGWEDIYEYRKFVDLPVQAREIQQLEAALYKGWFISKAERDRLITDVILGSGVGLGHVTQDVGGAARALARSGAASGAR